MDLEAAVRKPVLGSLGFLVAAPIFFGCLAAAQEVLAKASASVSREDRTYGEGFDA